MSWGGAAQSMVTSLKNNKRNRENTFAKLKRQGYGEGSHIKTRSKKKLSNKAKEHIRSLAEIDRQNNTIQTVLILFFSIVIFGVILYFVLK